ncbi:MAG TPA: TRAP transporter fused permease subunit [candidate division Zixibacteria bacterium]|nr:TRAP transporter fused permease subunit [candidate division Zixibacteria bacterium]
MEIEETARARSLGGPADGAIRCLLTAIPVAGIVFLLSVPQRLGWLVFNEQYMGLFLALCLSATYLLVPARSAHARRLPRLDAAAALGGGATGLYIFLYYPEIVNSLGEISPERVVLGCATVLLLAEACRRLVGLPLVTIAACFVLYALFAHLFPGDFYGRGWAVARLATYLYLDANGIFGQALQVGSSIIVVFVLFGEVLYAVGGAEFLSDFSLALMGRFRGGPAKIAIVSSSLFGNISGSAVANVVVDGAFTIPMMKKAGYPPPVAAAVEAVASTGGQIMPPVMGAAAFLIAEYLQVPYAQVALAALVPALLYYAALFIEVDLLAARNGIRGLPPAELPSLLPVLKRSGSFVIPLGVLILCMFFLNRRPEESGLLAAGAALVVGWLTPGVRLGPREILKILTNAGRGMLEIAAITGLAGVVIGILQLTGLGFTLTLTLLGLGQESTFLLLLLTAGVSMVLGMGMPTTAVYVLLAVLVAPGLSKLGVAPIAAHLFIFYFGMLSMITPPVCLASYAAASIGKTDPVKTGWEGMRLCAIAYVVPFLFVLSPSLLLIGTWYEVALSIVTAIGGAILLGVGLVGYLFRPLGLARRALFLAAAMGLLVPVVQSGDHALLTWGSNGAGLLLAAVLWSVEWLARERAGAPGLIGGGASTG